MMPTHFTTIFNTTIEPATSADVRRMEMFNRARREEMNGLLIALTPRKLRKSRHNG